MLQAISVCPVAVSKNGNLFYEVEVDESKIGRVKYILKELWASGDDKLYKYLLSYY